MLSLKREALARLDDALVLAAPSADPSRRPNSRDNYDAYVGQIGPADPVLVVTSSIYLRALVGSVVVESRCSDYCSW
ncbi:MAG: hypothetical protein ACHQDY_06180, partial [Solirubrobacterales bacterium]